MDFLGWLRDGWLRCTCGKLCAGELGEQQRHQGQPGQPFLSLSTTFLLLLYFHLINFHTLFDDGEGDEQKTPKRKLAGEEDMYQQQYC